MKILETKDLAIPEIKVISYQRFVDERGYFTETYRKSDFEKVDFFKGLNFTQTNESFSKKGVIRGLHFQWNPYMSKLVRVINGRIIDVALDIRKGSPTFGKIVGYELSSQNGKDFAEWIWVPAGFAHGIFFLEEGQIEYFCTGEYSQGCEAGISPLAPDIDWSLFDPNLKTKVDEILQNSLLTDKDKKGFSLADWSKNSNSENFKYTA